MDAGVSNWSSPNTGIPDTQTPPENDPTMSGDASEDSSDETLEDEILGQQDDYDDLIMGDDDEDDYDEASLLEEESEAALEEDEEEDDDDDVSDEIESSSSVIENKSFGNSFPDRLSQLEMAFFGESTDSSSGVCLKERIDILEMFFNDAVSIEGSTSFQNRLSYLEECSKGNLVSRLRKLKHSVLVGDEEGEDEMTGGLEEIINHLEMYFFGETFDDDESGGGGFENRLVNLEKRGNLYVDRIKVLEMAAVGFSKDTSMKEAIDKLETYFYDSIHNPDENTMDSRLERLETSIKANIPTRLAKLEMASIGAVPVSTKSEDHDELNCLKASMDMLETFFFGRTFDQSESEGMGFESRMELMEENVRDFDERLSRSETAAFGEDAKTGHKKCLKERSARLESFFFSTKHDGNFEALLEQLEDNIL